MNVSLISLDSESLPLLCQWFNSQEAAGDFDGILTTPLESLQRRFAQGKLKSLSIAMLGEEKIGWSDVHPFSEDPRSAGITVQICKPEYRGKGYGFQIHKLAIAEALKNNSNIQWIEAWTHVQNIAEQRILEKIGFTRESQPKKQFEVKGQLADFYAYELQVSKINPLF